MFKNILYNLPFLIALFWLLYVIVSRRPNHKAIRKVLILYMADSLLLFFTYAAFLQNETSLYLICRTLNIFSLASIFPLYYIYLRLTTTETTLKPHYLWTFLPAIILSTITFIAVCTMNEHEITLASHYEYSSQEWYVFTPRTLLVYYAHIATAIIILLEIIAMAIASVITVLKYRRNIEDYYANSEERLRGLAFEMSFVIILALASVAAMFTTGIQHFLNSDLLLIVTSIFSTLPMCVIGFHSQSRRFTIQEFQNEVNKHTYNFSKNTKNNSIQGNGDKEQSDKQTIEVNISYIAERIVEVIEKKQLYLQTDLRITDICDLLSTNRTYISQAINNHLGGNFSDFINRYRLQYAKEILSDHSNDNYTIESLAEQAGFSSAASMNRTFRKVEGITPHQYRQSCAKP